MSALPFAQLPADPSLKDVLDFLRQNIFLSLCCHHVGTVQAFDEDRQTATVTINYKKTYYRLNPATGLYGAILVSYPILIDCPVICLGGGTAALTFPIRQGDECLVLFNDRDLDNWFNGTTGAAVATPRLHSFADAIILVGLRSLGKVLTGYDSERAVLRNGTAMVGVSPTQVKVANENFVLGPLIQELIDNIKTLVSATEAITVICAAPTVASSIPVNAAAIHAAGTALTATALKFGGLLE